MCNDASTYMNDFDIIKIMLFYKSKNELKINSF